MHASAVAEIQGLYGTFSFAEKLLQKIWLRGQFETHALVTDDGRAVRILHPGKWNLLGGPDFKGARLVIGGAEVTGDVELHLRAPEWAAHRHAADPAYDQVVLHVVLFPAEGVVTVGASGATIPSLALLPWLHRGLEEYAADEAVETLSNRPISRAHEELAALDEATLGVVLMRHARERWEQKVRFARLRMQRLGWEGACHHAALEILGYRFNRAPMLSLAAAFPLGEWREGGPQMAERAWQASIAGGRWSVQGVRPANHPRRRLAQYATWVQARPDWPERLAAWGAGVGPDTGAAAVAAEAGLQTGEVRRRLHFSRLRERIGTEVGGNSVGGTRLDNLICDGFLPLLTARGPVDLGGIWHHWFSGDLPAAIGPLLRHLRVFAGRERPACHGGAQGVLGWLLAQDRVPVL